MDLKCCYRIILKWIWNTMLCYVQYMPFVATVTKSLISWILWSFLKKCETGSFNKRFLLKWFNDLKTSTCFYVTDSELSLRYGLDGPGFESQYRQENFLFSKKKSRPALGLPQPPAQWVPGPFLEVKLSGWNVHYALASSADVMNECSYTSTACMARKGAALALTFH